MWESVLYPKKQIYIPDWMLIISPSWFWMALKLGLWLYCHWQHCFISMYSQPSKQSSFCTISPCFKTYESCLTDSSCVWLIIHLLFNEIGVTTRLLKPKKFIFHCSFRVLSFKSVRETLTQYGKNLIMSEYWTSFAIHWLSNRIERIMSRRGRAKCARRWTWLWHFAAQTLFCSLFFNFEVLTRSRAHRSESFILCLHMKSIRESTIHPFCLTLPTWNNSQTFKLLQSSILK